MPSGPHPVRDKAHQPQRQHHAVLRPWPVLNCCGDHTCPKCMGKNAVTTISPVSPFDHPPTCDTDDWLQLGRAAAERVAAVEAANRDMGQASGSWSLPEPAPGTGQVPVWSSRQEWQRRTREALNAAGGRAVCRRRQVSTEAVYACAVMASLAAESRTGRRVTLSNETLAARAGLSVSTVKRARRVLRDLGRAVELVRGRYLTARERVAAAMHHGGRQLRAASVWALTDPLPVTANPVPADRSMTCPQSGGRDPLPRRGHLLFSSLVSGFSPTRAQAPARRASRKAPRPVQQPRPLSVQLVAAELIAQTPALRRCHPGAVCDALIDAGIEAARWSGHDIATALNADTRERGWVWPVAISRPRRFLTWRLCRLDWTGPSPSEQAAAERDARRAAHARINAERAVRERSAAAADSPARTAARAVAADIATRPRRWSTRINALPAAPGSHPTEATAARTARYPLRL